MEDLDLSDIGVTVPTPKKKHRRDESDYATREEKDSNVDNAHRFGTFNKRKLQ